MTDYEALIQEAESGRGQWVKAEDMHPQTNVAGRLFRSREGHLFVFSPGFRLPNSGIDAWYFTEEQCEPLAKARGEKQ